MFAFKMCVRHINNSAGCCKSSVCSSFINYNFIVVLIFLLFSFWIFLYFFADNLNANDLKISCSNSKSNNSSSHAYHTTQAHLIQITSSSSSSLQITDLNDSTIKQWSKKAKTRSKYIKTNRKKRRKRQK
jgi:hypothetical protein